LDELVALTIAFNELIGEEASIPKVSAEDGSVLIGSLLNGWAFSVPQMASLYAKKFGSDQATMSRRLWGDNYFNPKKKAWANAVGGDWTDKDGYGRGFELLILKPFEQLLAAAESGDVDKIEKMLGSLQAQGTLSAADKKLSGEKLFHRAMQCWMPAGKAIATAAKSFVPNPKTAQQSRFDCLIAGPGTDPACEAVKVCDSKGDLLFQVGKLVPQPNSAGRFCALGRVFSGTLAAKQCFLLEEDYTPPHAVTEEDAPPEAEAGAAAAGEAAAAPEEAGGETPPSGGGGTPPPPKEKTKKLEERRIQGVFSVSGKTFNAVAEVPAGNMAAVSGVDQYILKRCTIAASKDAFPLKPPAITVSPVVRVAMGPKNAADLPKMVEGLRRLAKSCPVVETSMEDNGKHVLAACGQEHMRVLKGDLEGEYLPGIPVVYDDPSISYRETVTGESNIMCLSKSPNKHNRLFVKAEPLDEELCRAIESQRITQVQDIKVRSKILEKEFNWSKGDTLKIWSFGPAPTEAGGNYGANVLVDQTKAVQYLNEIKESTNSGLLWASRQSVLAEENMRGVRFNLFDVKLHADSIHRGMGQIQPTARRVCFASLMTADCRFQEPIFVVSIGAPAESQPGIMQALGACRGEFVQAEGEGQITVEAYVPIAETIGKTPFATVLTQKTNGKASASYSFSHWSTMGSDPLNIKKDKTGEWKPEGRAAEILLEIRKRKGMKLEKPDFAEYYDKL